MYPILKPIKIGTKNSNFWARIKVWWNTTRKWELIEDFYFTLNNGSIIKIPKGFVFDGASVPRQLWWFLSPTGILLIPGLIHDYAYRYDHIIVVVADGVHIINDKTYSHRCCEGYGKDHWDALFLEVAKQVNGMIILDKAAWLALKWYGDKAWKENRKKQ